MRRSRRCRWHTGKWALLVGSMVALTGAHYHYDTRFPTQLYGLPALLGACRDASISDRRVSMRLKNHHPAISR